MKKIRVKLDSRNRICLTKVSKKLATSFYVYEVEGKIVLEPLIEIPAEEAWLFKPENKEILKRIQDSFKEEERIDRGSFAKYAKNK